MKTLAISLAALLISMLFVPTRTYKLYLSPTGNDTHDGSDLSHTIKTLDRAQQILNQVRPATDIEIHILPGTYKGQSVNWTYHNGKKITFTAINFSKNRPIFDGGGLDSWFTFRASSGVNTNLNFKYIHIENYRHGLLFRGDRCDPQNGWNGNNHLYGVYFKQIGNTYAPGSDPAYYALEFVNSRNNSVINCHFVHIENSSSGSLLHAIYLAHYASNNQILRNRFEKNSGDPIRVRDRSNYNQIKNNRFIRTGSHAFYSTWYCSCETTNSNCSKLASCDPPLAECPSYGNEFRDNECSKNYAGQTETFFKYNGREDYCGELPVPRLRTSGNTKP